MSFGNTVTITVDEAPKVLNRINQDGYGSEYLLREATLEYRMKIRHSKESPNGGRQFDRHNVELTETTYATDTDPAIVRQAYVVLRNDYADTDQGVIDLDTALVDFLGGEDVIQDLVNWAN